MPFSVPSMSDKAGDAVQRVLDSGWLTTGPDCVAFEAELAAYLGQPHVVTVASCTQALELSLRAHAPADRRARADPEPHLLRRGRRDRARRLPAGAGRHRRAHADPDGAARRRRGGPDRQRRPPWSSATSAATRSTTPRSRTRPACRTSGSSSTPRTDRAAWSAAPTAATAPYATCLSFYATKNLPIGEGGAVATHDEELADWLRSARLHGMSRDAWRRYLPGGSWRYDVAEVGLQGQPHRPAGGHRAGAAGRAAGLAGAPARTGGPLRRGARAPPVGSTCCGDPRGHPGHAWHLYQVRVPDRDEVAAYLAERRHRHVRALHPGAPAHRLRASCSAPTRSRRCRSPTASPTSCCRCRSIPDLPDSAVDRVTGLLAGLLCRDRSEVTCAEVTKRPSRSNPAALPTLILGAGDAGREVVRALRSSSGLRADADRVPRRRRRACVGSSGLPVLGRLDDVARVAHATRCAGGAGVDPVAARRAHRRADRAVRRRPGCWSGTCPSFLAAVERDLRVSDLRGDPDRRAARPRRGARRLATAPAG